VNQGLSGPARDILTTYWQQTINALESENHDYKIHQLPLARIKKVMKADPDVKMISAEAPILFAKGCDIFITELTMRAWIHAEDNKRRTLQRSDIAAALAKSDMFDFLIDIVPREEAATHAKRTATTSSAPQAAPPPPSAPVAGANVQQAPHPSTTGHGGPNIEYPHLDSQFNEYRAAQFAGVVGHDAPYGNQAMAPYEGAYYGAMPQQVRMHFCGTLIHMLISFFLF
jgi:nuclear transcription factor Y gamma